MAETPVKLTPKGGGCAPVTLLIFLLVVAGIILGANEGIGWFGSNCGDTPIFDCLNEIFSEEKPADKEGMVTATGPYSYKDSSVNMILKIPLEGGKVEGSVSGDCGGKVTGTYDGNNNGGISGKFAGTCSVFFVNVPASATFGGVVNKDSKTVPISFNGSGGGFSHQDSMSLAW